MGSQTGRLCCCCVVENARVNGMDPTREADLDNWAMRDEGLIDASIVCGWVFGRV